MRLPRRTCCAAAVAAMTTTTFTPPAIAASSPLSGLRTLLEDYGEKLERRRAELAEQASLEEQLIAVNAQELELEAELEGVLNALDTPRAVLTPAQASGVEAILARLEVTRGRQQRYGWGQSSDANDLPYYGAWNIVFATEQASFGTQRDGLILRSAREWVYGKGAGGVAAECVYADPSDSTTGLLVTRMGDVTKREETAVQLDLGPPRVYRLSYTANETWSSQGSDGRWRDVTRTKPSEIPSVSAAPETAPKLGCAPSAGSLQTTYLSDAWWIVRTKASGAATVLKRTQAEALKPENGDGPDGFDARRFGPGGRKLYMFDTGFNDREEAYQKGKVRVRADLDLSRS